jgi:hypothetical protein
MAGLVLRDSSPNGSKNILEHLGGQDARIRVVARAMIAVVNDKISDSVLSTMGEFIGGKRKPKRA